MLLSSDLFSMAILLIPSFAYIRACTLPIPEVPRIPADRILLELFRLILFILFQSQENRIEESVRYYYLPQILIIIFNLKNSFISYQNSSFNLF